MRRFLIAMAGNALGYAVLYLLTHIPLIHSYLIGAA